METYFKAKYLADYVVPIIIFFLLIVLPIAYIGLSILKHSVQKKIRQFIDTISKKK